jgi:hypothetical protein
MTRYAAWLTIAALLAACGPANDDNDPPGADAGAGQDASAGEDAGGEDVGAGEDAAAADSGVEDAGGEDAGGEDAGEADAGEVDAGAPDACEEVFPGVPCDDLVAAHLKPSDPTRTGRAGYAVALDGDVLVVGVPGRPRSSGGGLSQPAEAGRVVAFARGADGAWAQEAVLTSASAGVRNFGQLLAFDGDTLAVVSFGTVEVFTRAQAGWEPATTITLETSAQSVAVDGDLIALGEPYSSRPGMTGALGTVSLYERVDGAWTVGPQIEDPHPGARFNGSADTQFGWSLALRGDTLAVGTRGHSGVAGDPTDASLNSAGGLYVFERDGAGAWNEAAFLNAPTPTAGAVLGHAIALADGAVAASSGPQVDDTIEVWSRDAAGAWAHAQTVAFGSDVQLSPIVATADTFYVGAYFDGASAALVDQAVDTAAPQSGAVHAIRRDGAGGWSTAWRLKSPAPGDLDRFGHGLAVSDDGATLAVGAPGEDSSAAGSPADDGLEDSGAVHVFRLAR